MTRTESLTMGGPENSGLHSDAVRYIANGYHAFIAIDDPEDRDRFVEVLKSRIGGHPFALIDGCKAESGQPFSKALISACDVLVEAIGEKEPASQVTVSGYLLDSMRLFETQGKQGFLIFVHIDRMIASQGSFEIEGALRSAMERSDNIAVVLCGSETTINEIRQDDRPFYLSHRIFRTTCDR